MLMLQTLLFAVFVVTSPAIGQPSIRAAEQPSDRGQPQGDAWVPLGQRAVTDRADHDAIAVTGEEGKFSSIKLRVRGAGVDFHRVVVHYRNGTTQKVELRNTIPAGGESRAIDLEGDDRVIRSVEFWYDARTVRGRRARVQLLGKR
jgi:hypothetical protein